MIDNDKSKDSGNIGRWGHDVERELYEVNQPEPTKGDPETLNQPKQKPVSSS